MLGWALNEEDNILPYIDRAEQFLRGVADDFELVLIDDGSTDRTAELASKCAGTRPWLRVFSNERNRGSGYNTKRAITLAQKDYVMWQTVDWSYDISQLGASLSLLEEHDVLQGVRADTLSLSGLLRRRSDTPAKAGISIVNYALIRLLFRLPLRDYQNVTVYPRGLIQSVRLESESSFTNPECLLKVWWRGATIKEVSVPFLKRERGSAKGTRPAAVVAAIKDVLYWWWRWVVLAQRTDKGSGRVVALA
jgi:glycosyltransferase involved in cell wall biosynthesis